MVLKSLTDNLLKSFVDNVFRDKVTPVRGSILYCDLVFDHAQHSGVYLGENKIVHLDGSGKVEMVSPERFLRRLDGWSSGISICVSCAQGCAVGSDWVANNALSMLRTDRDYNLILDNCHQFTSGCISGNFENSDNFLLFLKNTTQKAMGCDEWRVWEL